MQLHALVITLAALGADDSPHAERAFPERIRGMSWVAGGEITGDDLDPLLASNVEWIVQTPFGWQERWDSTDILLATDGRILWGERDEGLRVTTKLAKERGLKVMLKPHLWLRDRSNDMWRGKISMPTEEAWATWFGEYRTFIMHYARLAAELDIEAFCIGTELRGTIEREDEWRAIIAEVRSVYDGLLTYGSNWYLEYEEVPFWDALDCIGLSAYFPISEAEDPTVEELVAGWRVAESKLRRLSKQTGKRVLFTELGYKSTPGTAAEPWEWPQRGAAVDLDVQTRCIEAFYRVFWAHDWFVGVFWWKWYPDNERAGGAENADYTPQNKPALDVIRTWYDEGDDE